MEVLQALEIYRIAKGELDWITEVFILAAVFGGT